MKKGHHLFEKKVKKNFWRMPEITQNTHNQFFTDQAMASVFLQPPAKNSRLSCFTEP
jgi:hypothetical protein